MIGKETNLKDCWVIEPDIYEDERGYFFEGFNTKKFVELTGIDFSVKQLNQSRSVRGVLRGLHFQRPPMEQAKLVSCPEGEILDVAVDMRKNSPTYKKYFSIILSEENKKQLFIPKGFAHGFLVLSKYAKVMYMVDELYSPEHDGGIIYTDRELNISWMIDQDKIILSNKDLGLESLSKKSG